jgi:folate-dependent phosphoribosylglycinamide formyltransferase PurN
MLSGGGRTMVNVQRHIEAGTLPARIVRVLASGPCAGCDRARELGVEPIIVGGTIPRERLGALLAEVQAEYVVLAGYLKRIEVPTGFANRIVNIHPALLPAFGGKGMFGQHVHEAVLAHGCKVSGCTVHLCDDQYDTGPILVQRTCPVFETDTPEMLAARVFEQECIAYPEALAALVENRVQITGRRAAVRARS